MKTIALISLIFISTFIYSQSVSSILSVDYNIIHFTSAASNLVEEVNESVIILDSTALNDPIMQGDPLIAEFMSQQSIAENQGKDDVSITVELPQNLTGYKLHYKVGRTLGANDVAIGYLNLDQDNAHNPITIYWVMNRLTINLGFHSNINNLFGEFYLESSSGATSSIFYKEIHF